jgi:hypothetical protein
MNNLNPARPIAVTITDADITVSLADGRKISNPISWFPWLQHATPDQQANIELWQWSIDFPDLDNGIDIEGMLRGIKPRLQTAP